MGCWECSKISQCIICYILLYIICYIVYAIICLDFITYQALVLEGIVDAPEEKPERPQIFESKLQKVICQKYECPQ